MTIDTAFIVAAGKGTRMAPLTDHVPKPLVKLRGRPLLDYVFDHLLDTDVRKVTVNTHHFADQISDFLATRAEFDITESYEPDLLETGGGLQKALPSLVNNPIFMINGDAFWTDGPSGRALQKLAQKFDPSNMDMLLLLIPVTRMLLTEGVGDYDIQPGGRPVRNRTKQGTHMFTGIRIVNPSAFNLPEGKYSFLQQMDEAEAKGRLYALEHDGDWHHISTPDDLARVDTSLTQQGHAA